MKKLLSCLLVAAATLTAPALQASTNQWRPNDAVKAVIPFAPGGGTDGAFRHFQKWAEDRGIKVVAVYKGGAEGLIGMDDVARGPADGLTISFGTVATAAVHRINHPTYNFNYVSVLRGSIMTFVTHPKSGIANLNDLEREVRNPETRKTFAYGAPGQKLAMEQLFKHTGTKKEPTMIPYKGGGPVVQDLLGGHIDVGVIPMAVLKPHLDSGKLVPLGITVREPWTEVAGFANLNRKYPAWQNDDGFMISLPTGVRPEVLAFWTDFVRQYLADKVVIADFQREFTEISVFGSKVAQERVDSAVRNYKREVK